jgi:hypothetical protein
MARSGIPFCAGGGVMVYSIGHDWNVIYRSETVKPKNFNRRNITNIDMTQDDGLYIGYGRDLTCGRPVHTEYFPTVIRYIDKRPIPDFHTPESIPCVSAAFKEVVECFEPGVHQFVPVEFIGRHKVHLATMYFMVICNRIDSADREHTTTRMDGRCWAYGRGRFVFNNAQIGTHHMWRDKFLDTEILMSDSLAEALLASGLTGFNAGKGESV